MFSSKNSPAAATMSTTVALVGLAMPATLPACWATWAKTRLSMLGMACSSSCSRSIRPAFFTPICSELFPLSTVREKPSSTSRVKVCTVSCISWGSP